MAKKDEMKKKDRRVLAEEVRKLDVHLTEQQRIEAGKELALTLEKVEEQEAKLDQIKKDYQGKIKLLNLDVFRLRGIVNHGIERRDVNCEWVHYKGLELKHLVRIDTGEVVEEMPVSDAELQASLEV